MYSSAKYPGAAATNGASSQAAGSASTSLSVGNPSATTPATFTSTAETISQAEKDARQKAWRETTTEDEKRMRFLALLCGRGSFPNGGGGGVANTGHSQRERSGSLGGMGGDINGSSRVDGDGDVTIGGASGKSLPESSSAAAFANTQPTQSSATKVDTPNYQPTTPQNLSRRILHRQGVGYLDDAVSLVLSSLSDRFLATVLVQATACRDRRLEGYKALLKEQKARKRHRRRVVKERSDRVKRFNEEMDKRRSEAEAAVKEGAKAEKNATSKAASSSIVSDGDGPKYALSELEKEKLKEFKKENEDIDAEEDYYHSYYGKSGEDADFSTGGDNESDGEDSDEEEEVDERCYDLLLRDLVRPLSAWGVDLTGKLGFDPAVEKATDEYEYVRREGGAINESDEGEGSDDEDDNNSDNEGSDDDGKPPSPVKKKTTTKKATKRKRDDKADDTKKAPATKKKAVAKDKSTTDKSTTATAPAASKTASPTTGKSLPVASKKPAAK